MPKVALQGKRSRDEVLQCTQPTVAPGSLGSVFKLYWVPLPLTQILLTYLGLLQSPGPVGAVL